MITEEQDNFDAYMPIRCTADLKKEITALAKADGRKPGAYARRVLELHVEAEKKKKK